MILGCVAKKLKIFLIGSQIDARMMKYFEKNRLRNEKKVVLLHPLSEGEGLRQEGSTEAKFFESLRPAQDLAAPGGAAGRRNLLKVDQQQENIEAEPEIQRNKLSTTILQRRV